MTVYYGGDLCDSEESDWEDPDDVVRREYVDQYNFDLLEGMEPMAFVPGGNPSRSDRRDEDGTYLYDGNDAHVSDDELIVDRKRKTWRKYCASIFRMGVRKDDLFSVEDWADTEPHRPLCRMRTRIGLTVGVSGLPLTVCNLQFRSSASNVTLLREGMTWLCFLSSADAKTGENGAMSMELGGQSLDHCVGSYGTLVSWDNRAYASVMIASV